MDKSTNHIGLIEDLTGEKGLKLVSLNIRSLFKKVDQCRIAFHNTGIDIVALSETWLKSNIPTAAVDLEEYCCIRQDRDLKKTSKKAGGGLITYVHNKFRDKVQSLNELSESNQNYEALWVKLNMPSCRDVVVCNFYRTPNGKMDKVIPYLENCLSSINLNKTDLFIVGDFNVDFSNKKTNEYKKISFFIKSNQLCQLINESTRITDKTKTTIDLIITNCEFISRSGPLDTFLSDHRPTYVIKKKHRDARPKEIFYGRSYKNFNEEDFRNILGRKDWVNILDTSTPEKAWQSLFGCIKEEVDRFCPYKKFTVRAHKPEWLDNNLIEQIKDRDYFYKKAKRTQEEDDWNVAKHLRNTVNYNIRQAKAVFIQNELNTCKNDPKKFGRIIKRVFPGKCKSKTNRLFLNDNLNNPINSQDVPDYINQFFVNIGQKIAETNTTITGMVQRDSGLHINNTREEPFEIQGIKEVDVYKEVANINIKKSSGFPNINSRVLKEAFKAVIPELTAILNLSIKSTTFPDSWKLATVIPIPKKGDLCQVENYRPISLLPLPGKLLERVVHVQLEKELEESGFYTDYQYGFRKSRSTTHATLQLVNHINYKMDKNIPTAAIFIDFKKAFDCVNHQTLIDKLETTNFGIDTINWIKDYLSNRQQCVMANNLKSSTKRIKQGVPQGSTLGPLFYIIYANDMPKCIRSNISLYADDTVIYHSSRDGTHLMLKLQEDMDRLQQWSYKNKLTINTNKTKMMVFGRKGCREKLNEVKIRYGNTRIEEVTQYNYLGINLDQTLKYDNHAKAIIQRASDKIRYLKRIRKFITSAAALNIYKNMILPIFEYGDILLVSASATLRKRMQILQNKALKCALGLDPTTGSDEVHRLAKLEKLSDRRDLHLTQIMFSMELTPREHAENTGLEAF